MSLTTQVFADERSFDQSLPAAYAKPRLTFTLSASGQDMPEVPQDVVVTFLGSDTSPDNDIFGGEDAPIASVHLNDAGRAVQALRIGEDEDKVCLTSPLGRGIDDDDENATCRDGVRIQWGVPIAFEIDRASNELLVEVGGRQFARKAIDGLGGAERARVTVSDGSSTQVVNLAVMNGVGRTGLRGVSNGGKIGGKIGGAAKTQVEPPAEPDDTEDEVVGTGNDGLSQTEKIVVGVVLGVLAVAAIAGIVIFVMKRHGKSDDGAAPLDMEDPGDITIDGGALSSSLMAPGDAAFV